MSEINVANVTLLGIPGGDRVKYEELRGYDRCTQSGEFVSFTWCYEGTTKIKERISYSRWRVLELVETVEEG